MFTFKEVQRTDKIVDEVFCDNCGKKLVLAIPADAGDMYMSDPFQCHDALHIELHGGFGMYFDDNPLLSDFCRDCADALKKAFPVLFHWHDPMAASNT